MTAASHLTRMALTGLVLGALGAAGCSDREREPGAAATRTPAAATPSPAATPTPRPDADGAARVAWTHDQLVRRLEGRRVRVAGRRIPLDAATLTCGGVGAPARRVGGEEAWTRFRCVQPTFPPGKIAGPDAIFHVEPRGGRSFEVTGARLTSY